MRFLLLVAVVVTLMFMINAMLLRRSGLCACDRNRNLLGALGRLGLKDRVSC